MEQLQQVVTSKMLLVSSSMTCHLNSFNHRIIPFPLFTHSARLFHKTPTRQDLDSCSPQSDFYTNTSRCREFIWTARGRIKTNWSLQPLHRIIFLKKALLTTAPPTNRPPAVAKQHSNKDSVLRRSDINRPQESGSETGRGKTKQSLHKNERGLPYYTERVKWSYQDELKQGALVHFEELLVPYRNVVRPLLLVLVVLGGRRIVLVMGAPLNHLKGKRAQVWRRSCVLAAPHVTERRAEILSSSSESTYKTNKQATTLSVTEFITLCPANLMGCIIILLLHGGFSWGSVRPVFCVFFTFLRIAAFTFGRGTGSSSPSSSIPKSGKHINNQPSVCPL